MEPVFSFLCTVFGIGTFIVIIVSLIALLSEPEYKPKPKERKKN